MKSNAQLKNDVIAELVWEPSVNADDIVVTADNGIVTLTGTVPHYAAKWAAERATQRVQGVKGIAEEIDVNTVGIHDRKDTEIAKTAAQALAWHVWVPSTVQVKVESGLVTLTGKVSWEYERKAAEQAVRYLSGIKGVDNEIDVKPAVQPGAVKDAIVGALKRDAEVDAENIDVAASGGRVTLSGTARTWSQRQEAGTAAWNAPGVTDVQNDLEVAR
jgi:osmotically-inducible protein OsmY